jgi:WD40 repeat protein
MARLTFVACILLGSLESPLWAQGNPLDAHGDPLQDGATLRLGTQRWRQGGKVRQAAFIDNQTLLTCGEDLALRVWDVATGKQIRQMEGGRSERFALSADRKTLVGLSDDYHLTLFEVSSGRALRKFKAVGGSYPIALSPNGNYLAVGRSYDVQIFELDDDKVFHELKFTASALAFSPDNKVLAAGVGKAIQLWSVSDGKKIADIPGHNERIIALAFLPSDPNLLLTAAYDQTVRWWDVAGRKETGRVKQGWTTGLGVSPDGKTLAVGGHQIHEGILLYDVASRALLGKLPTGPENTGPGHLAFSPDSKLLASSSGDAVVRLYDVEGRKRLTATADHAHAPYWLRLSGDGKVLATAGYDGFVQLWEIPGGKKLHRLPMHGLFGTGTVEFVDKGKALVAYDARKYSLRYFDVATGKLTKVVQMPALACSGPALSPDGTTLALSEWDRQTLVLAGAKTGEPIRKRAMHEGLAPGQPMAFSADGRYLVNRQVIFDTKTDKFVLPLGAIDGAAGERFTAFSFALSRAGDRVVFASSNGLRVHEVATGKRLGFLDRARPTQARTAVAFSTDGKHIAWGGREAVYLLDAETGKEIRSWTGHRGLVRALLFSPDGNFLLSAADDTSVLAWDLKAIPF